MEPPPVYQLAPAREEPPPRIEHPWQRRLFLLANQCKAEGRTVSLTVIFHSDGCVTFFSGRPQGKVCP